VIKNPPPEQKPGNLFLLAVWLGLITGFAEAASITVMYWLGRCPMDKVSPFLWTIPITNACLFAVAWKPVPLFAYIGVGMNLPPWMPNSTGPVEGVCLEGKFYIQSDAQEELYDMEADPEETNDLARTEAVQPLFNRCRQLVTEQMTARPGSQPYSQSSP
jgi:hypothetical protein